MSRIRIGNNVRKLRFNRGEMTQEQLAAKVGVTRQTIVSIEKGKYYPSLELAFRLALAFEVPLEEVFFLEDSS
ncbi:helix-turn-helix transcriptional regulator [Calidithermus chliarophilus]|uniref:helix-turn-helix transcriptional regulator n=1 Tax=Calidithermus chliarophilus TaxID=52023 RepID=UPI0003F6461B|nr:helix-turn-helix transcriptional regulator [Calidithermus chliarophilus]